MNKLSFIFFTIGLTCCSIPIAKPHSLKFNQETFDPLARDIVSQKDIFEMDDFTRYYKALNGINIRFSRKAVDSFDNAQFFDHVVDSSKLSRTVIEDFRSCLS